MNLKHFLLTSSLLCSQAYGRMCSTETMLSGEIQMNQGVAFPSAVDREIGGIVQDAQNIHIVVSDNSYNIKMMTFNGQGKSEITAGANFVPEDVAFIVTEAGQKEVIVTSHHDRKYITTAQGRQRFAGEQSFGQGNGMLLVTDDQDRLQAIVETGHAVSSADENLRRICLAPVLQSDGSIRCHRNFHPLDIQIRRSDKALRWHDNEVAIHYSNTHQMNIELGRIRIDGLNGSVIDHQTNALTNYAHGFVQVSSDKLGLFSIYDQQGFKVVRFDGHIQSQRVEPWRTLLLDLFDGNDLERWSVANKRGQSGVTSTISLQSHPSFSGYDAMAPTLISRSNSVTDIIPPLPQLTPFRYLIQRNLSDENQYIHLQDIYSKELGFGASLVLMQKQLEYSGQHLDYLTYSICY